jgi:hypothetical protein
MEAVSRAPITRGYFRFASRGVAMIARNGISRSVSRLASSLLKRASVFRSAWNNAPVNKSRGLEAGMPGARVHGPTKLNAGPPTTRADPYAQRGPKPPRASVNYALAVSARIMGLHAGAEGKCELAGA